LKFNESYYNTSAADKYYLVDINMKEIEPKSIMEGYTRAEVEEWFAQVKREQSLKTADKKVPASQSSSKKAA